MPQESQTSPESTGAARAAKCSGSTFRMSESKKTRTSAGVAPLAAVASNPRERARALLPTPKPVETTVAPAPSAAAAVPSRDPSSTTTTWPTPAAARAARTTAATVVTSLRAGMTTSKRGTGAYGIPEALLSSRASSPREDVRTSGISSPPRRPPHGRIPRRSCPDLPRRREAALTDDQPVAAAGLHAGEIAPRPGGGVAGAGIRRRPLRGDGALRLAHHESLPLHLLRRPEHGRRDVDRGAGDDGRRAGVEPGGATDRQPGGDVR